MPILRELFSHRIDLPGDGHADVLTEPDGAAREDRSGLVKKTITVHRGNSTYQTTVMVKPEDAEHVSHARAGADTPTPGPAAKPAPRPVPRRAAKGKEGKAAARYTSHARRRRVIHAVRNEGELATAIGGYNLPDSEPADVAYIDLDEIGPDYRPTGNKIRFADNRDFRSFLRHREMLVRRMRDRRTPPEEAARIQHVLETLQPLHFFEVKTLLTAQAGAVHMSKEARKKKEGWVRRYHAHFHLVALDDRRGGKYSGHRFHFLPDQLDGTTRLETMTKVDTMAGVKDHAHRAPT